MTTNTETSSNVVHTNLRKTVESAIADGSSVTMHWRRDHRGQLVETVVIDGERAGQACGGDATWGDWDERTRTIRPDSDPHSSVGLDGEVG